MSSQADAWPWSRSKCAASLVNGRVPHGVYAKDVILTVIQRLGVKGGAGYAYEYAGDTIERMSMDERMTICNMSIEGAARVGYVNPDKTTFEYLQDRPFAPAGSDFDEAVRWWSAMASDADARFDDEVTIDAASLEPTVTWGINPGQSIGIGGRIPSPAEVAPSEQAGVAEALAFMGFEGGAAIAGTRIDVAFVGSCTNSRLSDLREAARVVAGGPCRASRAGARRARLRAGAACSRTRGTARAFPGGRLRVARRGLLHVPGDEPRSAERT